ncbi:MAG: TIGR01841 family phasin [Rhodospirillales bacterium]
MAEAKKPTVTAKPAAVPTKPADAAPAASQVEAVVVASKETVETVAKVGAEVAAKSVEKAVTIGQEQVTAAVKAGGQVFKTYEDAVTYGKDNVDAFVQANNIMAKGMQDLNKVLFAMAQKNMEETVDLTKKVFGCKSVDDVVKLQSSLLKTNYSKAFDESRKISDMAVKLAEEAAAPIADRMTVAVEKVTKPLAA